MVVQEIELKFRVDDAVALRTRLGEVAEPEGGAVLETHVDLYYRHPCRDFKATGEALRVRWIDGRPHVTYKGPKRTLAESRGVEPSEGLAQGGLAAGGIKMRKELEWELAPGDPEGAHMVDLLESLGFAEAARVRKRREVARYRFAGRVVTLALDEVDGLGLFAELELVVGGAEDADEAALVIERFARALALETVERRSYLGMALEGEASR